METHDEVGLGKLGYESVATLVCGICEDSEQEHFASLPQAKRAFERKGWRERDGVWVCRSCQSD